MDLRHLCAVPFFLTMLNSDDKTVGGFARTSLFPDAGGGVEVLRQRSRPGLPSLREKSKLRPRGTQALLDPVRFSQTELTSATFAEGLVFFSGLSEV